MALRIPLRAVLLSGMESVCGSLGCVLLPGFLPTSSAPLFELPIPSLGNDVVRSHQVALRTGLQFFGGRGGWQLGRGAHTKMAWVAASVADAFDQREMVLKE